MNIKQDISLLKLLIKNIDKWYDSKDFTLIIRYGREPKEAIKDYLEDVLKGWIKK